MGTPLKALLAVHGRSILLTFEIFWILIFLLDRLGGQAVNGIPQFIYVNF